MAEIVNRISNFCQSLGFDVTIRQESITEVVTLFNEYKYPSISKKFISKPNRYFFSNRYKQSIIHVFSNRQLAPRTKPANPHHQNLSLFHHPFNVADNQKSEMGNSHPQQPSFILSANSIDDWVKVQEQGHCQLWMHRKSNKQVQAYPIPQSFVRNQDQLQKYHFRKAHRDHLVVVEAILTPGNSSFCSQPRTAYALVQNITGRLSQFKRCLSFEQALYVLSAAASGYNTLNSFFGPLEPHAEMVCFNDVGEVKIWLNQNLALNELSQAARALTLPDDKQNLAQRRTKEGVKKLLRIVEQASINQFAYPFNEECKKLSNYFQTANMISYFCYANNIELPSKVVICKNLHNPSVNQPKMGYQPRVITDQPGMIIRQDSNQSFQGKVGILASSRVKTVLFKSIQAQESQQVLINPVPILGQISESVQLKANPRISQEMSPSPKITFNIRSTLPAQLSQQKVEGVLFGRPIFKTPVVHPNLQFIRPQNQANQAFSHAEPKIKIRLEEVKRTKNLALNSPVFSNVAESLPSEKYVNQPIIQNKAEQQLLLQSNRISQIEAANNQTFINKVVSVLKIPITNQFFQQIQQLSATQMPEKSQNSQQIVQTISEPSSEWQIPQQPHSEQYIRNPHQVQDYGLKQLQENNIKQNGYFYFHQQEPNFSKPSQQEINRSQFNTYQIDSHHPSHRQQSEYQSQDEEKYKIDYLSKQEQIPAKEEMGHSAHSHIEKYSAPANHSRYPQSPIIQQLQQNFSSPPKDNAQIQQWQARLTKFTQSHHSQHELEPLTFQIKHLPELIYAPSVEYRKPELHSHVQEPANQLAHLDQYGIEDYIRRKYNLYSQPSSSHEPSYQSSKKAPNRQRVSVGNQFKKGSQGNSSDHYLFQQKTSYKSSKLEAYNEPWREQATKDIYQKQNYYPSYQDYQPNRDSIQLTKPESYSSRYLYQDEKQDKYLKREPEKPKYKASQMSKIDQRYSKYVMNANRTKQSAKKSILSKDVSQILGGDERKISHFSPKPALSEIESVKRGSNAFVQGYHLSPKYKNEVTYEKLRNLLWEE